MEGNLAADSHAEDIPEVGSPEEDIPEVDSPEEDSPAEDIPAVDNREVAAAVNRDYSMTFVNYAANWPERVMSEKSTFGRETAEDTVLYVLFM